MEVLFAVEGLLSYVAYSWHPGMYLFSGLRGEVLHSEHKVIPVESEIREMEEDAATQAISSAYLEQSHGA